MIPFDGTPLAAQLLLTVAFVVIASICAWTAALFLRGQRAIAGAPAAPPDAVDA